MHHSFNLDVNNLLIMSITKMGMLLLLLVVAKSTITGFTLQPNITSFPNWQLNCSNLVFTHSFKTSVCEKYAVTGVSADGEIVLKAPAMSTPQQVHASGANSSQIWMDYDGLKLFLNYNGTTGYQYFYNLKSGMQALSFTLDSAAVQFSFSNNSEYFAYKTSANLWTLHKWNQTVINETARDTFSNARFLRISDDGNMVAFISSTNSIQFHKYNPTTETYQLARQVGVQTSGATVTDLECYFIDSNNVMVATTETFTDASGTLYRFYLQNLDVSNTDTPAIIVTQTLNEQMEVKPFSTDGKIIGLAGSTKIGVYSIQSNVATIISNSGTFMTVTSAEQNNHKLYYVQNATHTIIRIGEQIYYREDCASDCTCPNGYEWMTTTQLCRKIRDCSVDPGSTNSRLTTNQCQCLPYLYWDAPNEQCQPHCFRDLAKGVHPDNPLQCECRAPAIWNAELKDCYLDCKNVTYSNGQHKSVQVCNCIPPTKWNPETLSCDYDCEEIPGAIVDPYDNTVCTCVSDKHFWSEQKLGCFRKCWEDPNSDGTVFANDTCGCKTNYQWDLNMARCLALNCEVIHYSTYQVGKDCQCQTHFQWESELRVCIIQCNTITTNADFINPAAERVNFYECPCLENSIWDAPQLTCRRNCQLYSESAGNKNHTHCYCKIGFQWNDTAFACETSCGQRTGELAQYDQEANHCVCDTAYYWDSLFGACYRNCSLDSNAVDVDFTNPLQCECKRNYVWSTDQDKCVLPCSGVFDAPLTQGTPNPTTQCPCQTNAIWDTRSYMCVVQCPADPLSSGSFDFINYQCVCIQYTEWNSILNKCQCESGTVFNTQTQTCDNSVSGSAVSIAVVGGTTLVGSLAFAGFKIFKKKQKKKEDQKNEQGVGRNGIETEGQMKEHHDL